MFLEACRAVAKDYPEVKYEEDLLDRVCLRVVQNPAPYASQVMVMPNLVRRRTGDAPLTSRRTATFSATCVPASSAASVSPRRATLVRREAVAGRLSPTGKQASIFEAVHGSAPDIAGAFASGRSIF